MINKVRKINWIFVIIFVLTIVTSVWMLQIIFEIPGWAGIIVCFVAGSNLRRLSYVWDDKVWPVIKTFLNNWALK